MLLGLLRGSGRHLSAHMMQGCHGHSCRSGLMNVARRALLRKKGRNHVQSRLGALVWPPPPWILVFSGTVFHLPVVPIYPHRSQSVELGPAWNVGHRCWYWDAPFPQSSGCLSADRPCEGSGLSRTYSALVALRFISTHK